MIEPFVARVSRGKTLLLVLGALAFVAAGIWFVGSAETIAASSRRALFQDPAIVLLFGWIAILFFGACGLIGVRQLFRSEPVMEIDDRGILWRRRSDQPIPWDAIVRIEPCAMYNQKFLCLWLDDPARYPAKSTLRKLSGLNKGMGFGDVALSMQGTDRSFDQLLEVVGAHLDNQRVGTGSGPE